jgi:type IV secretion/conjugal transfer VirB4 family ATPase
MRFLSEYRRKAERLFDHLPWACLIAPGVILNKDGAFQKTLSFRGPDVASTTAAGLLAVRAQLNNAFRRLGSRWCLHVEARRGPSPGYPTSSFPDPVSEMVDEERRRDFVGVDRFFESRFFLTLTMLPPDEKTTKLTGLLIENAPEGAGAVSTYRQALAEFVNTIDKIKDILRATMPQARDLTDDETLTYLHGCISTKNHWVRTPPTPAYLDAYLTDDTLTTGLYPRLGPHFMRTLSIRAYPSDTSPGILDQINELGVSYRWVSRYLVLDKQDAIKELTRMRKLWWQGRKSIAAMVGEAITQSESSQVNLDALSKAQEADEALAVVGGDMASYGYFTPTITLTDPDSDRLAEKVRQVEAVINRAGFVAKVEDANSVESWLGSLPGEAYADVRRPMISTLSLCDLIPMSAIWPGPTSNAHLTAECGQRGHHSVQPPLMYVRTAGSTPFRLDLHQGDVGHTMIVGPTGAGKSVLLNTLALQWMRYPEAQVFFFDKGASSRAATLLTGGEFHFLGGPSSELAFQPLADLSSGEARAWAQGWALDIIAAEGVELSPHVKEQVWSGLNNLAAGPVSQRTLTMLAATIQDHEVKAALQPYTLAGPHGHLLDAHENHMSANRWQTFEMNDLMGAKSALAPVLTYVFRALEKRFDGRPTLLVLDEAWLFLDHGAFAAKIREWLKALRKMNVAVVFATQSLADVMNSSIAPALIESCPSRFFLPNPDALTPQVASFYSGFGLNDQQVRLIAMGQAKREYYFQTAAGNRLIELGLGPVGLAAAASSSPGDQQLITKLLAEHGPEGFAAAFFGAKGLAGVADQLRTAGAERDAA